MIHCVLNSGQKVYLIAFHYLSLLVRWTGKNVDIDILYLILKSTYYEPLRKCYQHRRWGRCFHYRPQLQSSEPPPFLPDSILYISEVIFIWPLLNNYIFKIMNITNTAYCFCNRLTMNKCYSVNLLEYYPGLYCHNKY